MISGWRANERRDVLAERRRRVGGGADDPVVLVGRAARRRARDGPAVERVAVVLERRRARPRGDDDVVDERAGELDEVVAGVADRDLDVARRRSAERSTVHCS